MNKYDKDLYFVAVKLFIRNGDKLLITHDIFGDWDLPGGRIRKDEFNSTLNSVIDRKINEELGKDFKFNVGQPNVFFRVERNENNLNNKKVRIFGIGYDAEYLGGAINLGDHHDKYEWVDLKTFKASDYFVGGWLDGVKEYLKKVN